MANADRAVEHPEPGQEHLDDEERGEQAGDDGQAGPRGGAETHDLTLPSWSLHVGDRPPVACAADVTASSGMVAAEHDRFRSGLETA